ncbi:MAG TPA: ABC transporter permease [Bryobacteraceae bacterium]|nr:ABC transporter permease [Bryobacteraceae bacterium]
MGILFQDLRYATRGLARNKGFALTALFAAALGIGSTTAVFSVLDRVLLRALPYADADRLVSVGYVTPLDSNEFLFADSYFVFRSNPAPFAAMTSFTAGVNECDLTETNPVRLGCLLVEGNFLKTLGVNPVAGRDFTLEEDRPGAPRSALISFALWRSRFAGDPAISGKLLQLDGAPVRIAGVLPANFETPTLARADVLLTQQLDDSRRNGQTLRVFARLKPGVSIPQADAELAPVYAQSFEPIATWFRIEAKMRLRSLRDRQVGDVRRASWVLGAAVLAVLLIACANLANLLLARMAAREKEWTVRLALGASRWRLARQTLTESGLLGLLGGTVGCALAWAFLRLFVGLAPAGIPRIQEATLDVRVLLFALAASLLTGLLFGIAPALHRPVTIRTRRIHLREWLVGAQLAASVLLLASAGMLLKSLWRIESVPLGFESEHVLTAAFTLPKVRYSDNVRQLEFYRQLEERLSRLPGASAFAITDSLPPAGGTRGRLFSMIEVEGQPPIEHGAGGMVLWRYVTPSYFRTLNVPIVAGRASGESAIVLSESMARKLFPGENPLGRRVKIEDWMTIVGVARDVKNAGLDRVDPEYYVLRSFSPDAPLNRRPGDLLRRAFLVVRTSVAADNVTKWLRSEFAAVEPSLPVEFSTLSSRTNALAARPRFQATLITLFAAMGVLLAAIGLYGVMTFLVTQRTREIGVRMALGSTPGAVARLVIRRAAWWAMGGAAAGVLGAIFAGRAIQSLLFEAPTNDAATLVAVVALLFAITLAAAWAPARRASRVDPMTALRHD